MNPYRAIDTAEKVLYGEIFNLAQKEKQKQGGTLVCHLLCVLSIYCALNCNAFKLLLIDHM